MNTELFLTRVALRRDAPIAALRPVFLPDEDERRTMMGHRLMWTLFGDSPERKRDFLWREAGDGLFYTLSERPPHDRHDVFHVDPPKRFAPELLPGDRMRFSLRANATVAKRAEGTRGKPADVVMDALYKFPKGEQRAMNRSGIVQTAGLEWLVRQGQQSGFVLASSEDGAGTGAAHVTSYRALRLDHRKSKMKIGVLDYEGVLTVTHPETFVTALSTGFGRAKAFGCGLMLIRRV